MMQVVKRDFKLNKELEDLGRELQDLTSKVIDDYQLWLSEQIEMSVREYAEPKIKGDITKGKLKWRGVRLCNNLSEGTTWIEQRGVVISPKFNLKNHCKL